MECHVTFVSFVSPCLVSRCHYKELWRFYCPPCHVCRSFLTRLWCLVLNRWFLGNGKGFLSFGDFFDYRSINPIEMVDFSKKRLGHCWGSCFFFIMFETQTSFAANWLLSFQRSNKLMFVRLWFDLPHVHGWILVTSPVINTSGSKLMLKGWRCTDHYHHDHHDDHHS